VPVQPPKDTVDRLRAETIELPSARIKRIADTLSFYDADVLVTGGLDPLWSAVVAAGADPKEAANVLANQFVAAGHDPAEVEPAELAKLVSARAEIPRAVFDEALAHAAEDGFSADPYLAQKAVSDVAELDPIIDAIIAASPGQAEQYRGGKEGLLGFFVGQVMKQSGGTADPKVVSERLREKLGA
jgi:aspartyl-tRNA(Asn)/glutamyl-tRNA(Gln) amidotransferase subunit B